MGRRRNCLSDSYQPSSIPALSRTSQICRGQDAFPVDDLMGPDCVQFVLQTMSASPRQQIKAEEALDQPWRKRLSNLLAAQPSPGSSIDSHQEPAPVSTAASATWSDAVDHHISPTHVHTYVRQVGYQCLYRVRLPVLPDQTRRIRQIQSLEEH